MDVFSLDDSVHDRSANTSDENETVAVPPLFKISALWGKYKYLYYLNPPLILLGFFFLILTPKSNILYGVLLLSGAFIGVSSNTRYQIINGLEHVVEASPMNKRFPAIAMAFTVGARFSNNIYGGMQFVDWARWSGCH